MSARTNAPRLLAMGFGFIGLVMLLISGATGVRAYQDTQIGTSLIETGEPTQALVVTATRVERSQCSRSQRAICVDADNLIATIVYQIDGLRAVREFNLTREEFTAYKAGEEVLINLIYLPAAPLEVERTAGDRRAAAQGNTLTIFVQTAFGIIFLVIGALAGRALRKRAPAA